MKIRFIAPKWLKRRREKEEDDFDWLTNIIIGSIVALVGISLIGPISDGINEAAENITYATTEQPQVLFDIIGSKIFLFVTLVVVPFLILRSSVKGENY